MYMYLILILIICIYLPTRLWQCNNVLLHVIYYIFLSLHVFLNVQCNPNEQVSRSSASVWWQPLLTTNSTVHVHVLGGLGYFSFSSTLAHWTLVTLAHWMKVHCANSQYAFILSTVLQLYYYSMLYYLKTA